MQTEELLQLVERVLRFQCEFQTIEVKAAAEGCPTRLYDSLSSFSNQDQGGTILFGLDEKKAFQVVGVYDVQDLQHRVAEQCKQMEPEVRPLFTVAERDGVFIVSAEIPGVDVAERPVFYKGSGRLKGSYVRVGESDEPMNEYEVYTYDAFRRRLRDDLRVVENAKCEMLQQEALQVYLAAVKRERDNLATSVTDDEILELMGVVSGGKPTLSGVLAFGKYPQAYFPQLSITAVVVPGNELGDTGTDGERFIANKRLNGTLSEMLKGAVEFVQRNSRVKTIIDEYGQRRDKPEFPLKAVRELILNALVHRDYSIHTEGSPITIYMFGDRIEITNKGGLYGRISVDSLGKVQPETRNPALANILELLGETENRYSGIPTIRREMREAGLPEPVFQVQNGEFKVILFNNMRQEYPSQVKISSVHAPVKWYTNLKERERELLEFCTMPRSREEIIRFMGFSRYYTMNSIVKPLVEAGLLEMSHPDKPKSPLQRYSTAGL